MKPGSLYICYFGIREPLVQTQVLPYLREIRKDGIDISILTFEPTRDDAQFTQIRDQLAAEGIGWHWLPYHKRLSVIATAWDIFRGAWFTKKFTASHRPEVIHCRVHVPMLMGAIGRKLSKHKPKLLFDIRGFFPEEYTDAGIWPENGILYRTAKRVERWLMKQADGFVVLTERAREILFPESAGTGFDKHGRPVEVIPCCVDLSRFAAANGDARSRFRAEHRLDGRFVVAYVGAFGGWYLTDDTASFFGAVKQKHPDAFALVLTQSRPEMIADLLEQQGYNDGDLLITRVKPAEIPNYLSGADLAVSFIKRCYSKQASSPTKNAEYLACGLPIIANAGVGDVDLLIEGNRVGAIVNELTSDGFRAALDEFDRLGDIADRCRTVAREQFDLESVAGVRYRRLYQRMLELGKST